jgi:tryptophan synthase
MNLPKRAKPLHPVKTVAEVFSQCKIEKRIAFIPYLTAGFPTLKSTVPLLLALQRGGADIIELGMPFSDPLADGPTIQKSSFDALENGIKLFHIFEYVREAREEGLTTPIIIMGYYNPFQSYGLQRLVEEAESSTVEGFIIVDLPPDETPEFSSLCASKNLCFVPLVAPTSTNKRLEMLGKSTTGYVYAVSITGVTGARTELADDLPIFVSRVQKYFKDIPIVIGFGVSTRKHVQDIEKLGVSGAVVGSAVINDIREHPNNMEEQVKSLELFVQNLTK